MNVSCKTSCFVLCVAGLAIATEARGDAPAGTSVAAIQAKHDRALIRDLTEYLRNSPKADDRDQAYAALFNKSIEHDWFTETDELAQQYLKSDPDGPVKALAQIIQTMARAQAGRYEEALTRYKELMQGLGQSDQEEFAASFSDTLANSAIELECAHPLADGTLPEWVGAEKTSLDDRRTRITVTSSRPARTMVEMIKWVDENGIELADIRIKQPSLEDAFIELTGKSLRE